MIQTKVLVKYRKGANLDIEPKDMIRPKGKEKSRVRKKSISVTPKPSFRLPSKYNVTSQKFIKILK